MGKVISLDMYKLLGVKEERTCVVDWNYLSLRKYYTCPSCGEYYLFEPEGGIGSRKYICLGCGIGEIDIETGKPPRKLHSIK